MQWVSKSFEVSGQFRGQPKRRVLQNSEIFNENIIKKENNKEHIKILNKIELYIWVEEIISTQ